MIRALIFVAVAILDVAVIGGWLPFEGTVPTSHFVAALIGIILMALLPCRTSERKS